MQAANIFSVENRVAFVTGAGAGLGREMALVLAANGARLACFDMDAAAMLTGEAAGTARGRRLLARHALNAGDTDAALEHIAGLNDAAAVRLRGEAMLLRGEAERAATVFKSTGADDGAARAAWLSGDWTSAAAYDANGLAENLSALGLVPSDAPKTETTPPTGELETGRNLVTEAAQARDALGSLVKFAAEPPAQ